MQRYEESRKKARKWWWREGIFAQENDANDYNLLTISMIQKSIFRINELTSWTSRQVNKLIEIIGTTSKKQNVVITGSLINLFTCLLIPISMKSGFFEDYKRQRGKITPGEGLYYLVLSPFLSECKTVSFNLKSLSILF